MSAQVRRARAIHTRVKLAEWFSGPRTGRSVGSVLRSVLPTCRAAHAGGAWVVRLGWILRLTPKYQTLF